MAFIGHPILADIRKGMRLRPTQTVDKSRPIIQVEGESIPAVRPRGPEPASPAAGPPAPPPPPPAPPLPSHKSPPAAPHQPPPIASNGPPVVANARPSEGQRQKLLAQIRGGIRLRHVQTMDKSGLVLDDQEKQQLLRATTPNGSLDSQGKSPSPSLAACSSASSSSSHAGPLSPSPPGALWPSNSSSADHHFANSPSPSPPGAAAPVKHWPEVLTEKQRAETIGQKNSDYQFDEKKQIEERQKEVAALSGRGSAQSRIAAFRQLQTAPPMANGAFCTLPRAQKTNAPAQQQNGGGNAQSWGKGGGGGGAHRQITPTRNGTAAGQPMARPSATTNGTGTNSSSSQNPQRSNNSPSLPLPPHLPSPPPHPAHPPSSSSSFHHHPTAAIPVPSSALLLPFSAHSLAAAPSPSVPSFFRAYTPRPAAGGAHRQNFERIRGQWNGKETVGEENGAEAVWKEAARQRKEEQRVKSPSSIPPPPLPTCSPPPLADVGGHQPDWNTLRKQFKFAVDLDGAADGTKLIRIVRR